MGCFSGQVFKSFRRVRYSNRTVRSTLLPVPFTVIRVSNYLIQNSPAVKLVCGPKKAIVKKDVKSRVAAKKWL